MGESYDSRVCSSGRVVVARLKPGSDLYASLQQVVEEKGIKAAVILSGVGLLGEAGIRNCRTLPEEFPITDVNRSYMYFEKPLEIIGLSGNVSVAEGKPLVHVHLTLSYVEDDEIKVIGGHLIEGCTVFGFAEVFLLELQGELVKGFDEETKTLQLFAESAG
ncbi:MAG: DNA-binding protein [Candidatus Bathyarchaeota archaeon]|nr:DNA-binding protein [Candidatus Bathyarchaeota archaeon]